MVGNTPTVKWEDEADSRSTASRRQTKRGEMNLLLKGLRHHGGTKEIVWPSAERPSSSKEKSRCRSLPVVIRAWKRKRASLSDGQYCSCSSFSSGKARLVANAQMQEREGLRSVAPLVFDTSPPLLCILQRLTRRLGYRTGPLTCLDHQSLELRPFLQPEP